MPAFSYIARTSDGILEKGSIDAISIEHAREKLRKKGLMVDELREDASNKTINVSGAMPWTLTDDEASDSPPTTRTVLPTTYAPLMETIRLFAGWLLAWYALVYIFGSYRMENKLPVDVPFLQGLFESPLVLRFTFGTFLFLFFSALHSWMKKGTGLAILLAILWIVVVTLFSVNIG